MVLAIERCSTADLEQLNELIDAQVPAETEGGPDGLEHFGHAPGRRSVDRRCPAAETFDELRGLIAPFIEANSIAGTSEPCCPRPDDRFDCVADPQPAKSCMAGFGHCGHSISKLDRPQPA